MCVMPTTPREAPARIFYGYWVVLVLSVIVLLSQGMRFAIGPFLKPVSAELGLDRGYSASSSSGRSCRWWAAWWTASARAWSARAGWW